MKVVVVGFVSIVTLVAVVGDVRADADEARRAFQEGRNFYKARKYRKAADALARAYAFKPHPSLLRYLGMTYYKMKRTKKAIEFFKRYLVEAPAAPDRAKVEAKVRELEMVLGSDGSDAAVAAPPPPPPPPSRAQIPEQTPPPPPPSPPRPQESTAPTGEDTEVPDALLAADARRKAALAKQQEASGGTGAMTWLKWVSAGVAAGGLAAGIVFNRLAAAKADEQEQAVKSGNPTGAQPTRTYQRGDHDLQEARKRNETMSIVSFVVGGVAAGASVLFFVLDKPPGGLEELAKRSSRRLVVAPVLGAGQYGVAGQLTF
ncbi:MAG: hypothetical protein H6707_08085 [Deltaproteobacteria bacterium]|nr:hypothetical protein [Deltaproteobacteria bacterium]